MTPALKSCYTALATPNMPPGGNLWPTSKPSSTLPLRLSRRVQRLHPRCPSVLGTATVCMHMLLPSSLSRRHPAITYRPNIRRYRPWSGMSAPFPIGGTAAMPAATHARAPIIRRPLTSRMFPRIFLLLHATPSQLILAGSTTLGLGARPPPVPLPIPVPLPTPVRPSIPPVAPVIHLRFRGG